MGDPVTMALTMGLQMMQQRAQAKAATSAARAQSDSEATRLRQRQDIANRRRREQLKKNLATQRARMGASGAGSGGSADAVLRGLSNETARFIQDQESVLGTQIGALNERVDNVRRNGLLQRRNFLRNKALSFGVKGLSLLEQ